MVSSMGNTDAFNNNNDEEKVVNSVSLYNVETCHFLVDAFIGLVGSIHHYWCEVSGSNRHGGKQFLNAAGSSKSVAPYGCSESGKAYRLILAL